MASSWNVEGERKYNCFSPFEVKGNRASIVLEQSKGKFVAAVQLCTSYLQASRMLSIRLRLFNRLLLSPFSRK
jgi:hypothetical protein